MNFFSDDAHSVVSPRHMVKAFMETKERTLEGLMLEPFALITFTSHDHKVLIEEAGKTEKVGAWGNRNIQIHRGEG